MVNTLWNTPEKVTTTPNRSWSGMLKKIVAWAIALTLSGQPAKAKTFEKQEFPTEMVASIPWEISPMTENVEQDNNTDYLKIAEAWVKKYYPQYENYFKEIINKLKWLWWYEEYLINKEIKKKLIISWELLSNEKEIITSILESLEMIAWKENFKIKTWITEDEYVRIIAKDIRDWFFRTHQRQEKNLKDFQKEIEAVKIKGKTTTLNEISNEYITIFEKYMNLLKDFLLNYGYLKESTTYQELVKEYIEMLKRTDRKPSQIWQRYINEYNKIKN